MQRVIVCLGPVNWTFSVQDQAGIVRELNCLSGVSVFFSCKSRLAPADLHGPQELGWMVGGVQMKS